MPAISVAEKGALQGTLLLPECQVIAFDHHVDRFAFCVPALQHLHSNRVLQFALDHPLERACAILRVVPGSRTAMPLPPDRRRAPVPLPTPWPAVAQLECHDMIEIFARQRTEDHDIVDAIQEFGPEMRSQFSEQPAPQLLGQPASLVSARSRRKREPMLLVMMITVFRNQRRAPGNP